MHYSKLLAALAAMTAPAVGALADTSVQQLTPTSVEVTYDGGGRMLVDFYGPNIFRLFRDPAGGEVRDPKANPPAQILVDNPRTDPGELTVTSGDGDVVSVATPRVRIDFAKGSDAFTVTDLTTGSTVIETVGGADFTTGSSTSLTLTEQPGEYFYGGGVQNGRFSHKGKVIDIRNTNSWTDGGVASPTPFYWSTGGYGAMWHTFAPGAYDFGATEPGRVQISHESPYLDLFVMVDKEPVELLNDFYQLTGNPVLLPKFGFYEGHLNAYNRDYWTEDENGILFEDGKYYRESQKDNGGIKESLNGEVPGNYQFSARAVIDRYANANMPLGWVLPNDGYGAGYGQTSSLEGNVENLKKFGDYARSKGVEIGLWTQSDLHPVDGIEPLLQRDIVREVRDAGVRVLKTDVAWVGAGYSFGLNGVADVAAIMPEYGRGARPFIISLDGWAGTQRYAGIWTGDQTGGDWEYIRFHIPTYIGSGLSGQPNITSDMDGIFGGRKPVMNTRDFQWKTFTPMQLNMDGWGSNPKYPQIFGGNYEKIVRAYLKLKSELMPYAYTYAREAVDGKPLMRAMFIDYPNDYTHGTATKYQFLYGPDLLVAPIYQDTRSDYDGSDVRNGIYLPEGTWYDYFTGMPYVSDGTIVLNNYPTPLWKIPVFVKAGAIIPMVNPNNNPSEIDRNRRIYEIWPAEGKFTFTGYDDDGTTEGWKVGEYATTTVTSELSPRGVLSVKVDPTVGSYPGMPWPVYTTFRINVTEAPKSVIGFIGGKKLKLTKAETRYEFEGNDAAWYFDESPNRLGAWGIAESAAMHPQLLVKIPAVTSTETSVGVEVKGCRFNPAEAVPAMTASTAPDAPRLTVNPDKDIRPYAINLRWAPMDDASSVEILHNGMLYTNLGTAEGETSLLFEDLTPTTTYTFKVRAINPTGVSEWTEIDLRTADNPLEFAIPGIKASATIPDQPGFDLRHAFDFEERGEIWHSLYSGFDGPFDMTLDLGSFNTLDRLDYLPRIDAGNGTILGGTWQISENGIDWSEPQPFSWKRDPQTKTITFDSHPLARFIRLHINNTLGRFASAREIFVFKVPGTPSYLPGDINNDGTIDENDLTSYTNYTGLRRGDGDFDYVSMGDVNRNGLLDAYDISVVATRLEGGIKNPAYSIDGTISLTANKRSYNPGDEVRLTVKGSDLIGLNALSFALPYDPAKYEYLGTEPLAVKDMANLTYDRLHTAGDKVLYPTFVNIGEKPVIDGSTDLLVIKFRAKVRGAFTPKASGIIMVDRALGSKTL